MISRCAPTDSSHPASITATAELIALYLQTPLTFGTWDAEPKGPLERFPSSAVQPVRLEPEWDPEDAALIEYEPFPPLEDEFRGFGEEPLGDEED